MIGYDTVAYYAPVLFNYRSWGDALFISLLHPPQFSLLLYFLMILGTFVLNPYAVLAISAPALHGLLALTVYHYLRQTTRFARWLCLIGVFFVVVQFPVLDIYFAESLAISLGILTLSMIESAGRKTTRVALMLLLTGLAHQMVLLTLLPCIYIRAAAMWRKRDVASSLSLLATSIPALIFLGWNWLILQTEPRSFPVPVGVKVWFLEGNASSTGIPPFANYLTQFESYPVMTLTMLGFLLFLYGPLLPSFIPYRPIFPKIRKATSCLICIWASVILFVTLSPIVSPRFAFNLWYLWAVIVSVPLSIIAFGGFARIISTVRPKRIKALLIIAILVPYVILGIGYVTQPPERPFPYFSGSPFAPYMATSMLANTVPLQDSLDALALLKNLNSTMEQGSVLLVHEAFYGFAAVSFSGHKYIIDYFLGSVLSAASYAKQLGFARIYWIWWLPGYGWFGLVNPPLGFKVMNSSGRIAVYVLNQ